MPTSSYTRYHKASYEKNKEAIKARSTAYYQAHRAEQLAKRKISYQRNKATQARQVKQALIDLIKP